MTTIRIKNGAATLITISFDDDADRFGVDTELPHGTAGEAIGEAMIRFATHSGQEDHARDEVAALRARKAPMPSFARAMTNIIAEMNVAPPVSEINIDIGDWGGNERN